MSGPLDSLLREPTTRRELLRALDESHPGTDEAVEQGGFIVQDSNTGLPVVRRLAPGRSSSIDFPLCPDGQFQGEPILASLRTHPNVGPGWDEAPNRQDVRMTVDYPETLGAIHFVLGPSHTYSIRNDGTVTVLGKTTEVLADRFEAQP